eukprot:scaffold660017_cov60-Prasinocladus_malaysianus.AAC.1
MPRATASSKDRKIAVHGSRPSRQCVAANRSARHQCLPAIRAASNLGSTAGSRNHDCRVIYSDIEAGRCIDNDGSVVILGDIKEGGFVRASGDIIVWGSLQGSVHAGIRGDQSRQIYCSGFDPASATVAIASRIAQLTSEARHDLGSGNQKTFWLEDNRVCCSTASPKTLHQPTCASHRCAHISAIVSVAVRDEPRLALHAFNIRTLPLCGPRPCLRASLFTGAYITLVGMLLLLAP